MDLFQFSTDILSEVTSLEWYRKGMADKGDGSTKTDD